MHQKSITRAFIVMHLTVGLVVLALSVAAAITASGIASPPNWPLFAFATLEAVAAVFFLIPLTMRFAGGVLLIILLTAFFVHALEGDVQLALLVYAASTLFVVIHGSAKGAFLRHPAP